MNSLVAYYFDQLPFFSLIIPWYTAVVTIKNGRITLATRVSKAPDAPVATKTIAATTVSKA